MLLAFHTEQRLRISKWKLAHTVVVSFLMAAAIILAIMSFETTANRQFVKVDIYDVSNLDLIIPHLIYIPITFMILNRHNEHKFSPRYVRLGISFFYLFVCMGLALLMYLRIITPPLYAYIIISIDAVFMFLVAAINWLTAKLEIQTLVGHIVARPTLYTRKLSVFKAYWLTFSSHISLLMFSLVNNYVDVPFMLIVAWAIIIIWIGSRSWRVFISIPGFVTPSTTILRKYSLASILLLTLVSIALFVYTFFAGINVSLSLIDIIFLPLVFVPAIVSFLTSITLIKNHDVIDFKKSEYSLIIRAIGHSIAVVFMLLISVEIKYFTSGETQNTIYLAICSAISIVLIVLPYYIIWWKYMSSIASIFICALIIVIMMFVLFKWYFYAHYSSEESLVFGVLSENWYTIITLLIYIGITFAILRKRLKNNSARYARYGRGD